MYDFTGCECQVCHKLFRDGDDVVVCPDCGTPYHRSCYEETGHCLHRNLHGTGFEWAPPKAPEQEIACTRCGAMNEAEASHCKSCGTALRNAAGDAARYGAAPNAEQPKRGGTPEEPDYETLYREMRAARFPSIDPNEMLEGIPAAEWASFIGRSSYNYLRTFKRMELLNRKAAMSVSAMLWGHLYFFYRKAWKPAIICLVATLLLNTPTYLWMMKTTESALVAGLSFATLELMQNIASVLLIVLRAGCGLFGFYLYKKDSAAKIQRIRQQFPDPEKRAFVLSAQGGTSWLAVVGAIAATYLVFQVLGNLMGPNLNALYALLGL